MKKSELKLGQKVFIKSYMCDGWQQGIVTTADGVTEPFIQLPNGEEIFLFEIDEIKIA